jgi:chitin synthase
MGCTVLATHVVDADAVPAVVRTYEAHGLALNILIWLTCACAVFVIAVLGDLICPTEHVFSTSELASHSVENSPNNVFVSIRGEVFDLTQVAETHNRIVPVVTKKSVLKYGGTSADDLFPVQVTCPPMFSLFAQLMVV